MRVPAWPEQRLQIIMRVLFAGIAWVYYTKIENFSPVWMTIEQIHYYFVGYLIFNVGVLLHARKHLGSTARFRLAMIVDAATVTMAVLNDPYPLPPSLLVYIIVVLGNGMRYGLRFFAETLILCLLSAMLVLSVRYIESVQSITPDVIYLNLFGAIILFYSFILTRRYELNKRSLEKHSRIDVLTGLLNRRALFDMCDPLFDRLAVTERPLAVMFADMDKFKQINDTMGHAVGDKVLNQFADILRQSVRRTDIAARYGGDEFVLVLPNTTGEVAETIGDRIERQVGEWAQTQGMDISVSIGVGEAPKHGDNLNMVLEYVDEILYRRKSEKSKKSSLRQPVSVEASVRDA